MNIAWNRAPTIWDRIGDLLWGGGIIRKVLAIVGFMAVFAGLGVGLGNLALRSLYGYQERLAPLCDAAPAAVADRTVRHYAGTVVAKPSPAGRYRRVDPGLLLDKTVLFVQVDGRDQPLALLARPAGRHPPGTRLAFCAVGSHEGHWWPLVGLEDGFVVRRIYGEPSGPFTTVKWIRDLDG